MTNKKPKKLRLSAAVDQERLNLVDRHAGKTVTLRNTTHQMTINSFAYGSADSADGIWSAECVWFDGSARAFRREWFTVDALDFE